MSVLEQKIVDKFHQAILDAEPAEMSNVIDKLSGFFEVIEKRISLAATEVKTDVAAVVQRGM